MIESKIYQGFATIKSRLELITVANGYSCDANIREGWLQQIARRSQHEMKFPVVVIRPELSLPTGGDITNNTSMTDRVTVAIDCAVNSNDPDILKSLWSLLKDVRRSLVFDANNKSMGVSELSFLDCPFDVPDAGEEYAFFTQKIQFKVVEKYA